jgi:ribosomal protein S18 acetylase RimI-like enzyme
MSATSTALTPRRIHLWQHWHAVGQMLRAYPPGTDAFVDHIRAAGFLARFAFRHVLAPLYFAREQGWVVRGADGAMAALMYLRREARQGICVLHIDDINVDARYRRQGLAERLMLLAEELARREQRPFLKLAVTAANTPAITLYRRLGYQDQHHRHFTYAPTAAAAHPPADTDLRLRPLSPQEAAAASRQFYRMEMRATAPAVADMMVAYYLWGGGAPKTGGRRYAIEHNGRPIGYGDAHRRRGQRNLRVSLLPELWGTESERQAIQLLTSAVQPDAAAATTFALQVPCAAHFDALCAGPHALASELGLVGRSHDRMIMVKVVEGVV